VCCYLLSLGYFPLFGPNSYGLILIRNREETLGRNSAHIYPAILAFTGLKVIKMVFLIPFFSLGMTATKQKSV
jgi:hypothetical protein